MTSYKRVFTIKNPHGPGGVFFAWQRTSGGFLATTGYDQTIHIYNRYSKARYCTVQCCTVQQ